MLLLRSGHVLCTGNLKQLLLHYYISVDKINNDNDVTIFI